MERIRAAEQKEGFPVASGSGLGRADLWSEACVRSRMSTLVKSQLVSCDAVALPDVFSVEVVAWRHVLIWNC